MAIRETERMAGGAEAVERGCGEAGKAKWKPAAVETHLVILNKLNIELPYYPAIPALGINSEELKTFEKQLFQQKFTYKYS